MKKHLVSRVIWAAAALPPFTPKRAARSSHKCRPSVEVFESRIVLGGGDFYVSIPGDGPPGFTGTQWNAPDGSLRWAIDNLFGDPGAGIIIDAGVNPSVSDGTLVLPSFAFVLSAGGSTITSTTAQPIFSIPAGGDPTIENATLADSTTAIVSAGSEDLETVNLDGGGISSATTGATALTFNNGSVQTSSTTAININAAGGGVSTLSNVTLSGNTAQVLVVEDDSSSSFTATNVTITQNANTGNFPGLQFTGPASLSGTVSGNTWTGGTALIQESLGQTFNFTGFINSNTSGTTSAPVLGGVVGNLSGGTVNFTTVTAAYDVNNTGPEFYFTGTGAVNFVSADVVQDANGGIYDNGPLLSVDNCIIGDDSADGVVGRISSGGYDDIMGLDATTNPNGLPANSTAADPEVTGLTSAGNIIVAAGSPVLTAQADPNSGEADLGSGLTVGGTYTAPGGGNGGGNGGGGGSGGSGGSGDSGSGGSGGSGDSGSGGSGSGGSGSTGDGGTGDSGSGGSGGSGSGGNSGGGTIVTAPNGFNGVAGDVTALNGQRVYVSGRGYYIVLGSGRITAGKQVFKLYQHQKQIFPKLVDHKARATGVQENVGNFAVLSNLYASIDGQLQEFLAGSVINVRVAPKFAARDSAFLESGRLPLAPLSPQE